MKSQVIKLYSIIPVILFIVFAACTNDSVREREYKIQDSLGLMEFKHDIEAGKYFGLYHEGLQNPKLVNYINTLQNEYGIFNKGIERKLSRKNKMYNLVSKRMITLKYGPYFLDSIKNANDSLSSLGD